MGIKVGHGADSDAVSFEWQGVNSVWLFWLTLYPFPFLGQPPNLTFPTQPMEFL